MFVSDFTIEQGKKQNVTSINKNLKKTIMSKCTRATNVKLNINKEKEMGKVRSIIKKKVTLSK